MCEMTFLVLLLLLLFCGDDEERAFSNFFRVSDPSFVCFSSPNNNTTKFY